MFEAKLSQTGTFKKVIESIKDLTTEVNIEASPEGNKNYKKL
jgi:hypothetical protein